jgi:hypothetical protein
MHLKAIPIICLALFMVIISCSSKNPADGRGANLTEEAELAALWLSDEAFVPKDLAWEIQNKLALMREEYSAEIPEVNTEFKFPAETKSILAEIEPYAMLQVLWGTYHEWDSLNQYYGLDTIIIKDTLQAYLKLKFKEQINPFVVASSYSDLSGFEYAEANAFDGDGPNIYPWIVDGQLVFLVRYASGDCPPGCMYSKFWYFKTDSTQINLVGEFGYDLEWLENRIYPPWWEEIWPAYCHYRHRNSEDCLSWDD